MTTKSHKGQNEERMTLYHLINLPSTKKAIREKYLDPKDTDYHYSYKKISFADTEAHLYWGTITHKKASWISTIEELTNENLKIGNRIASAVLLIPDTSADSEIINNGRKPPISNIDDEIKKTEKKHDSAWAITFGMGFQMLDPKYIDSGFGRRVAIRCVNPDEVNTVCKATLDARTQMTRSAIPSGGNLRRFGFEELGDFLTSITANAQVNGIGNPEHPIKIKAADSLNIPLAKTPEKILDNLAEIKAIIKKKPISELAALEHLSPVKSLETKEKLEQSLIESIGNKSDQVALSYPFSIIDDFGQIGSFKILGSATKGSSTDLPTLDDLLEPIRKIDVSKRRQKLKNLSVILYKDSDQTGIASPRIPARKWLAYQTVIDDKQYFLQDNQWFEMECQYIKIIQQQVKRIFERSAPISNLPEWPFSVEYENDAPRQKALAEKAFNEEIARKFNGLCLDQKLIHPYGFENGGIEACDVLLPEGIFIHVKHVQSSAPASHLLAQALVSTEILRTDENAQKLLQERIDQVANEAGISNTSAYEPKPKEVVIVMAKDGTPITADSLFNFTKINLIKHDTRLGAMDVKLSIVSTIRMSK